jgi:hypothetical protein
MVKLKMLALGVSAVLGVATTVLIVMFSASVTHWFGTLSAGVQRGSIYAFIFVSVLLSVLNGWRLWRRAKQKRAA